MPHSSAVRTQEMAIDSEQESSRVSSVLSTLLIVTFCATCVIAWYKTSNIGYLIAGVGFLVVAPVWYQAPISVSILKAPFGSSLKKPRKLSRLNQVLSLVGYLIIIIGVCYAMFF